MNHYEVLNIAHDADKQAVKRAYFQQVKIHTPDADPEGFRQIRDAYETLLDDKKRANYDALFAVTGALQQELIAARELINQTKLKQAIKMLTEICGQNPGNVDASLLLAQAYLRNGNNGKAQKVCEQILSLDAKNHRAMFFLAKAMELWGRSEKAHQYYGQAAELAPLDAGVRAEYIGFLANHYGYYWCAEEMKKARALSPNIFDDRYFLYLVVADHCMMHGPTEELNELANKYTELFLADKKPALKVYESTVAFLQNLASEHLFLDCFDKLLNALLESGVKREQHEKDLKELKQDLILNKMNKDKRIGKLLFDLTIIIKENDGSPYDAEQKLIAENNLVMDMEKSRKQVKALRDNYPEFYELNKDFYSDLLNPKKEDFLWHKYNSLAANAGRTDVDLVNAHGVDFDFDVDGITRKAVETFVRETPKIGRNDPCPCGSGKKYKKCCGA